MTPEELIKPQNYRDRVSSVTEKGKRNWVYATTPKGNWYKIRKPLSYFFIFILALFPFIKISGHPFILINIFEGKFILFSKIFWPQDFFVFAFLMITFIVFIILFTIIYGRLFCGWVCPQTIFMEFIFRPIEWLIEGSPSQQKKLDTEEWNKNKYVKKISKHIIYFILSFLISNIFFSYLVGVDRLRELVLNPSNNISILFGVIAFSLLFYSVFAYIREIVCTTICPYGRLQSVLFDKNTMQISYDYKRGEPRGKIKKNEERKIGDCIDCKKCITVCPIGIDIRDGHQLDCVGCTACIDECDQVMKSIKKPTKLIRYTSENHIKLGTKFKLNKRIAAYSSLLVLMIIFSIYLVVTRKPIDSYISRVKGQLYQELPNNKISNLFEAKFINKTKKEAILELKVLNYNGTIRSVGEGNIIIPSESINKKTFFIDIPKNEIKKRSVDLEIGIYQNGELIQKVKTTFLGPFI